MTGVVLSAILIVIAALHLLWALGYWSPIRIEAARAVVGTRGFAAYTPGFRALPPEEPLATYDRRYHAPLCLILAALTSAHPRTGDTI